MPGWFGKSCSESPSTARRTRTASKTMPNVPARSRGFALLIVLWMLVLLAFVVAQMTAAGRTEGRIAGNLAANSRSQAAADGAIYEAIFHVSDARPEQHWQVDGSEHAVQLARAGSRCSSKTKPGGSTPTLPRDRCWRAY